MLTERARKDPGQPVGLIKFIVVASIVISILRSILTGKSLSPDGVLVFAVLAYLGYRVARLQPWWPFGEDYLDNLRKQAEAASEQSQHSPNVPPIVLPDHSRSPYSRKVAARKREEKKREEANQSSRADESAAYAAPKDLSLETSSVGTRSKTTRVKVGRQKTVGRFKRR
jgi:hypothetical protein